MCARWRWGWGGFWKYICQNTEDWYDEVQSPLIVKETQVNSDWLKWVLGEDPRVTVSYSSFLFDVYQGSKWITIWWISWGEFAWPNPDPDSHGNNSSQKRLSKNILHQDINPISPSICSHDNHSFSEYPLQDQPSTIWDLLIVGRYRFT